MQIHFKQLISCSIFEILLYLELLEFFVKNILCFFKLCLETQIKTTGSAGSFFTLKQYKTTAPMGVGAVVCIAVQ